jgi:hypothetical protein
MTPDQKALACNAVLDRLFFYDNDSIPFGIYEDIAEEYLGELEDHPFYGKLSAKYIECRMHKHARLMEDI